MQGTAIFDFLVNRRPIAQIVAAITGSDKAGIDPATGQGSALDQDLRQPRQCDVDVVLAELCRVEFVG